MTKKAFGKIAAGLEAAIEYAEGRADLDSFGVHVPAVDIAALRGRLELSREEFAARFGFTVAEVLSWETGDRPAGAIRAYLLVIEREHDAVVRALGMDQRTAA